MPLSDRDQKVLKEFQRIRNDPEYFFRTYLGVKQIYPKQIDIIESVRDNRRTAVCGCNGCVAPETLIENADTGEHVPVSEIQGEFPVWSMCDCGSRVKAISHKPFVKGTAPLYEIKFSNGSTIKTTMKHKFLTPSGWKPLASLIVGDSCAVDGLDLQGWSNASWHSPASSLRSQEYAFCPTIPLSCGHHFEGTIEDSQVGCLPFHRSYDGLLHQAQGNGLTPVPPSVCVRERNPYRWSMGVQVGKPVYTRFYQQSCRFVASREYQGESSYGVQCMAEYLTHALENTSLCERSSLGNRHISRHGQLQTLAYSLQYPLVSYNNNNIVWSEIQSITFDRVGEFYDLHVPGTNNYRAEGVFNHNSGKDWTSGRLIPWWLMAHGQAKVTVLGPTAKQVNDIVFDELRTAVENSPVDFGKAQVYKTPRYHISASRNAMGYSTDSELNITGRHTPHGLIIITEAHAVADEHINMLRTLTHDRWLMTGNPFSTSGEFYDAFHSKAGDYHTINISSYDTPNLIEGRNVIPGMATVETVEDRRVFLGEDSPMYKASVLGIFPEESEDVVIPRSFVREAAERELGQKQRVGHIFLSIDVARFGKDSTIITTRQGHEARIVKKWQGKPTTEIAGFILNYCKTNVVDFIVVDDVGVGGGVTDMLHEARYNSGALPTTRIIPFIGQQRARSDKFHDTNTEVWWIMRKWFMTQQPTIDNDPVLIDQLSTRDYTYTQSGMVKITPKDKMPKSPDEADSLAMSFIMDDPADFEIDGEDIPFDLEAEASRWRSEQVAQLLGVEAEPEVGLTFALPGGTSKWNI